MRSQTLLKLILLILFFEYFGCFVQAQDDCALKLDKAQKLYENGTIEDIPQMLTPCIKQGFSASERLQAFKLLILAYLFDQNTLEAGKIMQDFLKNYPEYQISSTDPAEFVQLFKSYRVLRFFSMGITLGGNLTYPVVSQSFITNGQDIKGIYHSGLGYCGGIKLDFYIAPRMDMDIEGYYLANSYKHSMMQSGVQSINSTESQKKLELPITLTYNFGRNKIRPYLRAGFSVDYLFSANSKNDLLIFSQNTDISGTEINMLSGRRQLNYNIIFGAGLKYKISRGYVLLEIRWKEGLFNQVLNTGRLNSVATFRYQNPDDDYTLNNLVFSVGYIHSFFKTKKKK